MSTIWTSDSGRGSGTRSGRKYSRESGIGPAMAPSKAGDVPTGPSAVVPTAAHAGAEAPGPPLHAALDYCARRLLAALDASDSSRVRAGTPLAAQLTPASDSLLRWWFSSDTCRARADNFHFAQRESILHTILAYELLHSDDPAQLYRSACGPQPVADAPCIDATRYRLRLAPGGGARWVVQALLVWWWANAVARADDGIPIADATLRLVAATPGIRRNLHAALFGHPDRDANAAVAEADVDRSSLLRHARLFLPPALRPSFRDWLRRQSPHGSASLQIVEAPDTPVDGPALTLIAMSGADPAAADPSRPGAGMRVDVMLSSDAAAAIVDAPLDRMIRRGAAKLPMLEATATLRLPALRLRPPCVEPLRHSGLRPHLARSHPALLRAGIDALRRREPGFATLDPARRPRLLVLCDAPTSLPAARRFLIDSGFAPGTIAIGGDQSCRDEVRAVVDAWPARSTLADARICVVVALRTHRGGVDPLAVVSTGAAPLWPEPDFAEARTENRERAVHRRAPQNLIDVLSVIEHPQCHAAYAPLLRAGLCAHGAHAGRRAPDRCDATIEPAVVDPAIDDLAVVALRDRAADFDLALPPACAGAPPHPKHQEHLSDLPRRVLRMRHALAVRKSVHTHACCDVNDSGLRLAFLECAESDPEIESHGLIDARRHAATSREAWLAQGFATRVWPDAVVRTADRVYLVNFQPFCPTGRPPLDMAERMFAHWLRRANALPASQRQDRLWCRATLAAPQFWSWKRSEARLSALLSELADAVAAAPRDDSIV